MTSNQIQQKLSELPFGRESIHVFGTVRINIHITCESSETANKWVNALASLRIGTPVVRPTAWESKVNKGTCMLPTMRQGWLVGLISS